MPARNTQRSPLDAEVDPAVDESARGVPGERGALPCRVVAVEQAALDEHLEAVADAEDQLAGVAERGERVGQVMAELVGEDAARGHVVAVAEPAGDAEDLVLVGELRASSQRLRWTMSAAPPALEGERGFAVAVGAGSTEDKDAGGHGGRVEGSGVQEFRDAVARVSRRVG